LIRADVAVALSLSLTHKAIGFDRRVPEVDIDALGLPATGRFRLAFRVLHAKGVRGTVSKDGAPARGTKRAEG